MIKKILAVSSGARKGFKDTFNRTNQTLDISSDGAKWKIWGSALWSVVSNKASTSTAASSYPLASVSMPKSNVAISLKGVSQGATAALWVTDSGNWWGVGIDQTTVSASTLNPTERALINCNCQTCANVATCSTWNYQCNTWNYQCNVYNYQCNVYNYQCNVYNYQCNSASYPAASYNYNCNTYNSGNCNNSSRYPMVGPGQWVYTCNVVGNRYCTNPMYPIASYSYMCNAYSQPCNSYSQPCNSYSQPCNVFSQPCNANNAVTYFECNCQTCYPQYVRFIQSVSGTVTTLTSWMLASVTQSFKVLTSGSSTTIKAYSDTDLVTQIGSDLTYTPTGVTITPQYGLMIKPSSYSQGNTIDEITIEVQ
jgi:hypothetical protein